MTLSEELRNKKSRDNRELLDRAANRIDELEAQCSKNIREEARKMTKEQLRQYRSIKLEICQIERRIKELEGRRYDADAIQPLRDLYREKLQALVEEQLRIEQAIESLTPTERELMRLRYIDGADWTEVAATIHYEWTQTHRIHARALAKIKNI